MNPINLESPLRSYEEKIKLKNAREITVKGLTFDKPVMAAGEPIHSVVLLIDDETHQTMGTLFYRNTMEQQEQIDKVKEICENPDHWLGAVFKGKIEN